MRFIMGHFRRHIDERQLRFIWADLPATINFFTEHHRVAELRKSQKFIFLSPNELQILYTRSLYINSSSKFHLPSSKQY